MTFESTAAEAPGCTAGLPVQWDLKGLSRPPATYPARGLAKESVRALFYDGPVFQGRATRVFAYYGAPAVPAGKKVPAIVLVHGGGGTAFESWVRLWNGRGYAAIAMDLCGCVPEGSYDHWKRHDEGGPPGWGGFDQVTWPLKDQWTYQAVADIILAHSLLASLPEVDSRHIGITGISWGGYLTCITAGVDHGFRFAVPVYGCGFLGENSAWLPQFASMGEHQAGWWLRLWDPSHYLPYARLPMLWVDGTNDFAYPPDSLKKSYCLPHGPRTLCMRVRMAHGHGGPGENPEEIHAFADIFCRDGVPLARVRKHSFERASAHVEYESKSPIVHGELNYTRDSGRWQDRKWETIPAELDPARRRVSAAIPAGSTVYYFNLIDERGLIVSSEHVEVLGDRVVGWIG